MTVPPYGSVLAKHNTDSAFADSRSKVNEFIKQQINGNKSMYLLDLYQFIEMTDDMMKDKLYDHDGLHFTEYGYVQIGQWVYQTMKPLLSLS